MASFSSEPLVNDVVSSFVVEHSELYKEQKSGDSSATVEGCFPPAQLMLPERVAECLRALTGLFAETAAAQPPIGDRRWTRMFYVRDSSLYESLDRFGSREGIVDLKTVADYMLLPKSVNEPLELEADVSNARRDYQEATGSYDLLTATTPKPRLLHFLFRSENACSAFRSALRGKLGKPLEKALQHVVGDLIEGVAVKGEKECPPHRNISQCGLLDGLMGESLTEFGYSPSGKRALGYALGCIIAGRPIPPEAVPPQPKSGPACDLVLEVATHLGDLTALKQFHFCGWRVGTCYNELVPAAAAHACRSRELLSWLYSVDVEAFKPHAAKAFEFALGAGHFETARWMLQSAVTDLESVRPRDRVRAGRPGVLSWQAAKGNNFDALKWLHLELDFPLHRDVARYACQHGNREMLDWYFSTATPEGGCQWGWHALGAALEAGRFDMALSLLERGRPEGYCEPSLLAAACQGFEGDTGVLDALTAVDPPLPLTSGDDSNCFMLAYKAAALGHVQALEWIARQPGKENAFRNPHSTTFSGAFIRAVLYDHIECVRWFLDRAGISAAASAPAVPKPKLAVDPYYVTRYLEYTLPSPALLELLEPYYDLSEWYAPALAKANCDTVRWLNKAGYKCPVKAGELGSQFILGILAAGPCCLPQWSELLRCLVDECGLDLCELEEPCKAAARGGSVETMQMLIEKGASLSPDVLKEAAVHGNLPLCRWLRQQGVAWPKGIAKAAKSQGAREVVAWIEAEQEKEQRRAVTASAAVQTSNAAGSTSAASSSSPGYGLTGLLGTVVDGLQALLRR